MSWRPEVQVSDGVWYPNALRFETKREAELNVEALMAKWIAVRAVRVVESLDPINYRWVDGKLEQVTP